MWSGSASTARRRRRASTIAAACLTRASGPTVSPGELFERLVARFDETLGEWRAGEAFESIRAAWLDCALGLGGPIVIENGGVKREGVFEGIDANGRLLIRSGRGLETVEAADLRILPASDARLGRLRPILARGRGEFR